MKPVANEQPANMVPRCTCLSRSAVYHIRWQIENPVPKNHWPFISAGGIKSVTVFNHLKGFSQVHVDLRTTRASSQGGLSIQRMQKIAICGMAQTPPEVTAIDTQACTGIAGTLWTFGFSAAELHRLIQRVS
eukprot:1381377-Amphidinium_carterae.1